jgi:hypothetical protein
MATIEQVQAAAEQWERDRKAVEQRKRRENRINYTQRAAEYIEEGMHPVTGRPLARNGETCGSCGLSVKVGHGAKDYWKCSSEGGRFVTRSEASDIRLKWPACKSWQPSPDSAPGVSLADLIGT